MPGQTFTGKVTEIGNSPLQTTAQTQAGQQATNFKVTVQIDGQIAEARPGFTCSAEITTATRTQALSVPDPGHGGARAGLRQAGQRSSRPPKDDKKKRASTPEPTVSGRGARARTDAQGRRKACSSCETARAVFIPVKTGIAGDKYFEVLSGLKAGDQVITGPFNSVRNLKDGDRSEDENQGQEEGHDEEGVLAVSCASVRLP